MAGRSPDPSAPSKRPAQRSGAEPPGVSWRDEDGRGVCIHLKVSPRRRPPVTTPRCRDDEGRKDPKQRTHCTSAGGQQDGRGWTTSGLVNLKAQCETFN